MTKENILLSKLFKEEYSKIIAVLFKKFGIPHVEVVEDIVNDTFLLATELWQIKGVPDKPSAWLYAVAQNKIKDHLKRNQLFDKKISPEIKGSSDYEQEIDWSEDNIYDSQLRMLFVTCNEILPKEAQVALALRVLCGLGIEEIAQAFLTNKETINKRLYRAKEKLRKSNTKVEIPHLSALPERCEQVLTTIYLLFNEGYYSSSPNHTLRVELCSEAMRLCYLLIMNKHTNLPSVYALLSLMCFHASRFEARRDSEGFMILYADQDRTKWNHELIEKGISYLNQSAKGKEVTKYHLEAGIAFWHTKEDSHSQKWENILLLYNQLLQIDYSPVAALNRTYALSQTAGKEIAIQEALKIDLTEHHLYHCLLAELYRDHENEKHLEHLKIAHKLALNTQDKQIIARKILIAQQQG